MTPDTRTHDEIQLDAVLQPCAQCGHERFFTHASDLCWLCRRPVTAGFTKRAIVAPKGAA